MTTTNLLEFDLEGLAAFCERLGEKRFRATQLFRWIHQRGASTSMSTAQAAIISVASHFARRPTAPSRSQSPINGPKRGCACSQSCSRREPRAAA